MSAFGFAPNSSWPGLTRPPIGERLRAVTLSPAEAGAMDGRLKGGHDGGLL